MPIQPARRPNVLIIIMDDLAWGDLACHGNPYIRTPHLDRMHADSVRLTRHCSGPLCTPARASLMTGRYPYRTRAIDTYIGRSMMDPAEVTLAEVLKGHGYRTGIFGKWHLGDCYPMRAMDQGFDEALVHNGGGIGQPGDIHGQSYFDPILHHNGVPVQHFGFCTDIFAEAACDFIEHNRRQPFFAYLATNAPHTPLIISDAWAQTYRDMGLPENQAKLYGTVENIDWNVGRILDHLGRLGLADDTIVMFTSDHGPCGSARNPDGSNRFNAGLRGMKGQMYEGGIKVPCLIRWPRRLRGGFDYDLISNPIDILPTLCAASGASLPSGVRIDGLNLLPHLVVPPDPGSWPDRTLFMQWHRGDQPDRYRNYAVINQQYKLYHPEDHAHEELYQIASDPTESNDLAPAHPEVVRRMRRLYEEWFDDVSTTRPDNYAPPRIHVGTPHENPTVLTRQDWRWIPSPGGGLGGWRPDDEGYWDIHVARPGSFRIRLRTRPRSEDGEIILRIANQTLRSPLPANSASATLEHVVLPVGNTRVEAWVEVGGLRGGVLYVDVYRPLADLPAETVG